MKHDDRRTYWTRTMDEALAFQEAMRTYPLEESGEELVSLVEAAAGTEVVFSSTKINSRHPRRFFAREGLISSFQAVAREMNARGWILKVEDAYRSPEMQRAQSHNPANFDAILQKVLWELHGKIPGPEFMLRRVSALIATRCRVGTHVSGSAIDISVLDRTSGEEIPRGGFYVEFSERSPMDSPFLAENERRNRQEITAIFHRHGWRDYPWEFWHYSQGDCYAQHLRNSGLPARYGPVAFDGNATTPLDPVVADALLEPLAFYETQIAAALGRLSLPERP